MSTKINISYQDKDYTLEYSRQSVRELENLGFVIGQVTEKPMTMIPLLFYGAFLKNHKNVKPKLAEEILDNTPNVMGDENSLIAKLVEMYSETFQSLTGKGDKQGNAVTWEVKKG